MFIRTRPHATGEKRPHSVGGGTAVPARILQCRDVETLSHNVATDERHNPFGVQVLSSLVFPKDSRLSHEAKTARRQTFSDGGATALGQIPANGFQQARDVTEGLFDTG